MKAGCGNLKILGDYLSPWRVMALIAQLKQVVLSNSSRTAQKFIQSVKKWDILRVYKASALQISNVWDVFQSLIVHVASRQYSNCYKDNKWFNDVEFA